MEKADFNIILFSIDGLRADHLSCYGYRRNTSPNMCDLAEDGVLFENAVSPGTITPVAYPSIITGLYPPQHGVKNLSHTLPKEIDTAYELLDSRGFNVKVTSEHSFIKNLVNNKYWENKGPHSFYKVLNLTETPFFVGYHSTGVHFPYCKYCEKFKGKYADNQTINESYWYNFLSNAKYVRENKSFPGHVINHFKDRYDESIEETDYYLGKLIQKLKDKGIYNETMIIITSEHGEGFMEHKNVFHGGVPYEEAIRVPLIIKFPKQKYKNRIPEDLARTIDIAPTIYDYAGIEKEANGKSLITLLKNSSMETTSWIQGGGYTGIRTEKYKYIVEKGKGKEKIYNLEKDPNETNNIINGSESLRERLKEKYKQMRDSIMKNTEESVNKGLSEEMKSRLKDMGYLN